MFIFKHLYTIIDKNAKKSIKSNNNVTRTSRSTEQGKGDKGEGDERNHSGTDCAADFADSRHVYLR